MIFLFFLLIAGASTLALLYLMAPYKLFLNGDTKTASITLNYCEDIANDTGSYTVNGDTLTLNLDYNWNKLRKFKFTILDNNTLRLETDVTACAPRQNEKFKRS